MWTGWTSSWGQVPSVKVLTVGIIRGVPSLWLAMPSRHCKQSMYRCIYFAQNAIHASSSGHGTASWWFPMYQLETFSCQLQSCLLDHLPPNVWYCKLLGTQKNQWDPFTMISSWFLSPSCGNYSRSTQCVTGRAKSRSQGNEVPLYLFYRNIIHASTSRSGTANEWFAGKTLFLYRQKITSFKMRAKSEQVRAMEWTLIKNNIVNETVKARALLKKLERDMP